MLRHIQKSPAFRAISEEITKVEAWEAGRSGWYHLSELIDAIKLRITDAIFRAVVPDEMNRPVPICDEGSA